MAIWPYLAFGFVAGAMLPIQFGINAQLATWVDSPLRATLISFAVGTARPVRRDARRLPGLALDGSLAGAPWWVWVGGLLGRVLRARQRRRAPKLGAATLVAVILAGQAFASLLVDHFGWVGFEENPITPGRLLGIALVAVGVALVRFF